MQIAVVGPGLIGLKHIQLIIDNPQTQLNSIVAPDSLINQEIASRFNVPLFYSIKDCLNSQKLDGVIISSPNEYHYEHGLACIEAGVPVLIEKPITSNEEEGRLLAQYARDKNVKLLVGHHRAYSPILHEARKVINEGRLGRLVSVIGSAQFYKPAHYFLDGPWRSKPGGGPILINLIHEIGNLRFLIGEISEIHAVSSSSIRRSLVEDTVAINMVFENGTLGTFLLSDTASSAKSWEQTSQENLSYPSYQDEECYAISGTKGSLSVPSMRLKYFGSATEPSWWNKFEEEVLSIDRDDPLERQFMHFIEVIKGNAAPLVSAEDGLMNLRIIGVIQESIKKRALVKV